MPQAALSEPVHGVPEVRVRPGRRRPVADAEMPQASRSFPAAAAAAAAAQKEVVQVQSALQVRIY